MPKSRTFGFFAALSVGLVLRMIATGLEAMGDKAPVAAEGVSGERLVFHSAALALTIGALVCFVWALYALLHKRQKASAELESIFAEHAATEVETAPAPNPIMRREQPKGFGRKST